MSSEKSNMIGKLRKLLLRRLKKLKFIAWCADDYWGEMIPEVLMTVKIFLKMAENGLKIQPVPNHVGLSGGRHEGISFMEFGFCRVHVKKHLKINFS